MIIAMQYYYSIDFYTSDDYNINKQISRLGYNES